MRKLFDAFITILAGAHGIVEVNTRLRSDLALQQAFGRSACADQSTIQDTLNACTADPTKPVDWALIAQQSGYYDQAHFNKDFIAHLGHSPTEYLQLRRRVQTENPEHDRLLRTLPFD